MSLVSKWAVRESFDAFSAYDAGQTDGLACVGFYGAVFDGRYVYWCPIRSHRIATQCTPMYCAAIPRAIFHDPQSWEAHDARGTDGLNTVCYYERPLTAAMSSSHRATTARGITAGCCATTRTVPSRAPQVGKRHDADLPHSHQGVAFDGRYLYFCPGYNGTSEGPLTESKHSGAVLRMDTQADFKDPATYRVFDTRGFWRRLCASTEELLTDAISTLYR